MTYGSTLATKFFYLLNLDQESAQSLYKIEYSNYLTLGSLGW